MIWDLFIKWFLFNLVILLVVGGIFCLVMFYYGYFGMVVFVMFIFYGLVFVNGSKYILYDLYYLGFCEIIFGCIGLFFIGWGFFLWIIGFGVLYILYGLLMYNKYE